MCGLGVLVVGRCSSCCNIGHNRLVIIFFAIDTTTKCGFEVNHVAQQNVFRQKFVAPDRDCLKGERAFAEPGNHRVAASLDALCNRDLTFTRQQLDAAHFTQIHPNRIIGAIKLFSFCRGNRHFPGGRGFDNSGRALLFGVFFLGLFFLSDLNAHFRQHRHHVFDLVRGCLIGRQDLVELVVGDVATLTRVSDHPFDGRLAHVERDVGVSVVRLAIVRVFGSHSVLHF